MSKVMAAWTLGMMCLVTGVARAGISSIEVSPLTTELRIAAGRAYTGTISVTNTGNDPQHIRTYCQDWALKPDGVVVFVGPGRLPNSASGWVQITPAEFDLAPGNSQRVRYTVRVPDQAAQEARTVILFEAGAQKLLLPRLPSTLIPRVGSILYVQVGPPPPVQAKITAFELGPDGGYLTVENLGAEHLRFSGRLEIRSREKLARSTELKGFVVLPPPFNIYRMRLGDEVFADLRPGEYEVTALLDCGGPSLLGARTYIALGPEPPGVFASRQ